MLGNEYTLNVSHYMDIPNHSELTGKLPCSESINQHVRQVRNQINKILNGEDDRLLVLTGPCSIHEPSAALKYAKQLSVLSKKYQDQLLIVMRTYFEKPRTTVGWKGYINDPKLNDTYQVAQGLTQARQLLLDINSLGLGTATEFLCPRNALYLADLISWGAIGARTTESQIHREMASALPCAVGFKNSVDGNIQVAIDAITSVASNHYISMTKSNGQAHIVKTHGNPHCNVVLRGGKEPNYHPQDIRNTTESLRAKNLNPRVVIDCSHGNSRKQHKNQLLVAESLCSQLVEGNPYISGVMLESFLQAGKQSIAPPEQLNYGQSITDACIHWQDTQYLLEQFADSVKLKRKLYQELPNTALAARNNQTI